MRIFLTICFLALFGVLNAQKLDSITHHYDSLSRTKLSLDPKIPDSLAAVQKLDEMKRGLTHKIDSLKSLNLPTEKYTAKLDSLNKLNPATYVQQAQKKVNDLQQQINKPINDLEQKVNQPLDKVESKINQPIDKVESKINEKLSAINSEAGGNSGLPGNVDLNKNVKLPDANIDTSLKIDGAPKLPNTDVKVDNPLGKVDNPLGKVDNPVGDQLGKVGEVKEKIGDIAQAPKEKIDQLKSIDEVKTVQEKAGQLNEITDKAKGYGDDAKKIANGDLGEMKAVPDAIESKAKSLDEIKELEKHQGLGEMDQFKDVADAAKDPEAMKQQAKQQVVTYAKNHFAGKEKALQAGMDQLSKLKEKYPDMPTVEQMKKRVYNAMNGKPFIERLVPGLTLQVQKTSNVLIDLNPVVAFRISGVWNAGLGWNERLSFQKWNKLEPIDRIYGPRVFTSVTIAKGFGVKVEGEKMNTYVPTNPLMADLGGRRWVWSLFVGIKKDYRISKNLRGNIQTLYNVYDDHDNSPYTDRLSVRMGFEIPMKKKVKSPAKK